MKTLTLLLAAILLCGFASQLNAQVEVPQNPKDEIPTPFDVDAISFASTTSKNSRLDIYAAIGYEQLSFVKKEDK